jgi:hypothetical protein
MADIIIPRAALEAGVKAFAEADQVNDYTSQAEDLATAFLAMLTAWPGMRISWLALNDGAIVLPLPPQEASDE